jgi:hypothetical protein
MFEICFIGPFMVYSLKMIHWALRRKLWPGFLKAPPDTLPLESSLQKK